MKRREYRQIVRELNCIGGLSVNNKFVNCLRAKFRNCSEHTLFSIADVWYRRRLMRSKRLDHDEIYRLYKDLVASNVTNACMQIARDMIHPPAFIAKIVLNKYVNEIKLLRGKCSSNELESKILKTPSNSDVIVTMQDKLNANNDGRQLNSNVCENAKEKFEKLQLRMKENNEFKIQSINEINLSMGSLNLHGEPGISDLQVIKKCENSPIKDNTQNRNKRSKNRISPKKPGIIKTMIFQPSHSAILVDSEKYINTNHLKSNQTSHIMQPNQILNLEQHTKRLNSKNQITNRQTEGKKFSENSTIIQDMNINTSKNNMIENQIAQKPEAINNSESPSKPDNNYHRNSQKSPRKKNYNSQSVISAYRKCRPIKLQHVSNDTQCPWENPDDDWPDIDFSEKLGLEPPILPRNKGRVLKRRKKTKNKNAAIIKMSNKGWKKLGPTFLVNIKNRNWQKLTNYDLNIAWKKCEEWFFCHDNLVVTPEMTIERSNFSNEFLVDFDEDCLDNIVLENSENELESSDDDGKDELGEISKLFTVKQLYANPSAIEDEVLSKDILNCNRHDDHCGPAGILYRKNIGEFYEGKLESFMIELGLLYRTEEQSRRLGTDKTPDVTLIVPIALDNFVIHWIESKALFADEDTHNQYTKSQYNSYLNRFGTGLVIYWFGFIDDIAEQNEGFIVRDSLPSKQQLTFLELEV